MKNYTICEYEYLTANEKKSDIDNRFKVSRLVFDELENFVLENKPNDDGEIFEFLSLSQKRNIGKILKAKNYVGVIQTKSGTTIEILPKIYTNNESGFYENTRRIFLKMLKTLRKAPYKKFNISNLKTTKNTILDIFINMFLDEVSIIVKKGLKSDYVKVRSNSNFFKGKLIINQHIKKNIGHGNRFFVEYDEYINNRAENRLIKSTLVKLNKMTTNSNIKRRINEYSFVFQEIPSSKNIAADFSKCFNNRLMKEYELILKWCKVFLEDKSFTNYRGKSVAYALLFPMEKIFESYVAKCIMKSEEFQDYDIELQGSGKYLIEEPAKFKLKPDIILSNNDEKIIMDTKWKMLDKSKKNLGISQSDLYQMYAYGKKYGSNRIVLLYPSNEKVEGIDPNKLFLKYDSELEVEIRFVELK